MRKLLVAAIAAAAVASGAVGANAAMLLFSDENDHKLVVNTDRSDAAERYAAPITIPSEPRAVSRGFLLGSKETNGKTVVNEWAGADGDLGRYGARIPAPVMGPAAPGFLLHSDDNDHKQVENQYAR